jgi:molybdate transport system substrate-binding protein
MTPARRPNCGARSKTFEMVAESERRATRSQDTTTDTILPQILAALLTSALLAACSHSPATLTVSVAASLQDCMPGLARLYENAHPNVKLAFNYGGSGALVEQIQNGAPADVLLAAAAAPMDKLAAAGLIDPGTRRDLLRNDIVLIAPKDSTHPASFRDLADPSIKLIALGDPASVPAGEYGREALDHLGLLDAVRPRLVLAKDVRQVLAYVQSGNADAGIVYSTDAQSSRQVRIVQAAPEGSHQPIVYPAAVTRTSAHPAESRAFLDFLLTAPAARVFTDRGFTVPGFTPAVP